MMAQIIWFLKMLKYSKNNFLIGKKTVKENVKSCQIFKNIFDFQMESSKLIKYLIIRH